MKIPFIKLNREIQTEFCTIPNVVSSTKNPDDETRENIIGRHEKFLKLPEEIKDKLVSQETGKKIQEIGQVSNLQLLQLADIARAVRSYYFGELKLEDMPAVLAREIGIDSQKAQEIANSVIKNIIQDNSYIKTPSYEKISLFQALEKYPRLGEQLVTSSPIKLKIFPDPVRPSIKNWIAEYHQVLGAGSHGTMERGNFLYHSENARRLSFGERQKLAVILKSLDENEAVSVDVDKQEIVFQAASDSQQATAGRISNFQFPISNKIPNSKIQNYFSDKANEANSANQANEANQADYHFSSPQRLQSEPPQPKGYQHFDPYHIDPVGYPEDRPKPEPPRPPVPPRGEPKINGNIVDLRG